MKLMPADWKALRPALLWVAGTLFFATLVVGGSYLYVQWDARALATLKEQTGQARQELDQGMINWQIMSTRLPLYEAIRQDGVLGGEHRLEWQEALDRLQRDRPALELTYEIAPQRALAGMSEGQAQILASSFSLKYRAADERVYSEVNRIIFALPGRLVTRHCRLGRPAAAEGISVDCRYDWLTIASVPATAEKEMAP